jgi:hypothetical protein
MRVYIAPRATAEDRVEVRRIEISPESATFVKTALERAYISAEAMAMSAERQFCGFGGEAPDSEDERAGYNRKIQVYGGILAEVNSLNSIPEPIVFDKTDIFPADMIHEGVLFGVGCEARAQDGQNATEVLAQTAKQIIYIEDTQAAPNPS